MALIAGILNKSIKIRVVPSAYGITDAVLKYTGDSQETVMVSVWF